MNHQPFETWLFDPAELDDEQTARLAKHLEDCQECRQTHAAWSEVRLLMNDSAIQPAPAGFADRFQASLEGRRQRLHRRQVRIMLLVLSGALVVFLTILMARFLAGTSFTALLSSGIQFFSSLPKTILDIRHIVSFWAGQVPPLVLVATIAIFAGWALILLASWFLTILRVTTQGVTKK